MSLGTWEVFLEASLGASNLCREPGGTESCATFATGEHSVDQTDLFEKEDIDEEWYNRKSNDLRINGPKS